MLVTVPMLSHKVILDLHQTGPAGPHPQVQLLGCSLWVTLLAFSSWRQQQSQGMHIHKHTYIDTADGTRGDCRLYEYISLLIFTCFFLFESYVLWDNLLSEESDIIIWHIIVVSIVWGLQKFKTWHSKGKKMHPRNNLLGRCFFFNSNIGLSKVTQNSETNKAVGEYVTGSSTFPVQ